MSKGGFISFKGSAAVAEAYLAGKQPSGLHAAAAASYLADGKPFQHGVVDAEGVELGSLSREQFRSWAEHVDPDTGDVRGSFHRRVDYKVGKNGELAEKVGETPLYHETLISSSKSLSLAAAANPSIGVALEAAMERATVVAATALHEHVRTRLVIDGQQVPVTFDRVEFTSVQHHTSRTGDPHFHRHMQVLSVGLVTQPSTGKQVWRSVNGAGLYRLSERLHAAADLAIATDVELREAIAAAGFTWTPGEGGGRVAEFETLTDEFSQRRDQVAGARELLEAQWRAANPGQEPSARDLRKWDNHGWAATRPDKHELDAEAQFDQDARLATVAPTNHSRAVQSVRAGSIVPRVIAEDAIAALERRRSAWSMAEMKAAIDRRLAETYLLGDRGLDDLRAAAMDAANAELVSFFDDGIDVEGAKHYTSRTVLATDKAIEASLRQRAQALGTDGLVEVDRGGFELTEGQATAARAITGTHQLVVVEGAAGTGKTTMLSAANEQILAEGRRLVAVSPTKRGAIEMANEIGAEGNSVHGLLVRAGAEFDDRGRWRLPEHWRQQPDAQRMDANTVLVVDEVGMLDMTTAEVLHRYCDDTGVQLVLLGDRRQLAAVGRGGYLTKAVHLATSAHDLQDVRRFQTAEKQIDQIYADASLELRQGENASAFFDLLQERGQVQLGDPDEVIDRVAETVALEINARRTSIAIASTNATAQRINHAVYDRLVASGEIKRGITTQGRDGDPIAKGAKVATRLNDTEAQVANRQTWIVKKVNRDGRVIVADEQTGFHATLEADYVRENLQLAYAVTAHGSQGMTVDTAHTVLSDQMNSAGAYVGLTRGRYANVLHVVAADHEDARDQFEAAIARQGSDQGLDAARAQAQVSLQELAVEGPGAAQQRRVQEESAEQDETPAPFRSGLRDIETGDPAWQARLAGLADLEERWHEQMPATDEDRREFERQVAAVGVGPQTMRSAGVQDAMQPQMREVLLQRAAQSEAGNAAVERRRDLTREINELRETKSERDPFGLNGTESKIREAKADQEFETGFIERLKVDRAAGVYTSREHERDNHRAAQRGQREQEQPTPTQDRVAQAAESLKRDAVEVKQHEQSQNQSDIQAM